MSSKFIPSTRQETDVINVDEIEEIEDVDEITAAPPKPRSQPRAPPPRTSGDLEEEELSQPFVDVHELFNYYNQKHFQSRITGTYVEYSTRMTLCAGTCTFKGARGGCRIALSEPLLKFRPRSDLVSTLLHEMIHALLFITEGVAARDGVDGHGPKFLSHADRINRAEGGTVRITPYHTFQDEVDMYRVHHWKCDRCPKLIKRAMNRAPAPRDPFWPRHQLNCGGSFVKTREPEKKKKVVKRTPKTRAVAVDPKAKQNVELPKGVMKTHRIDTMLSGKAPKRPRPSTVPCPVCNADVEHTRLNEHLDSCLSPGLFSQDNGEDISVPVATDGKLAFHPTQERDQKKPQKRFGRGRRLGSSSTKNKRSNDDFSLPDVYDLTESPLQSPVQNSRNVDGPSWRGRREEERLKEIIRDPNGLTKFALDPFSTTTEAIPSLFNNSARERLTQQQNATKCDLRKILKPILQVDTPQAFEERAKKMLRPLRLKSSGHDFSFREAARKSGMDTESFFRLVQSRVQKQKDGTSVLPADFLDLCQGGRVDKEGVKPMQRPDGQSSTEPSRPSTGRSTIVIEMDRRGDEVESIAEKARTRPQSEVKGESAEASKTVPPPSRLKAGTVGSCPVCDRKVPRDQLEAHVNVCLNSTDVGPLFGDSDDVVAVNTPAVPEQSKDLPRCPVCDVGISRARLESHVNECLMSAGLDSAF